MEMTRREFVAGAAATLLAGRALAAAAKSTADPLAEFDYGAVELTGGPLKQQYDRLRAAYLALNNDRLLQVYRQRAGLPAPGAEMGGWYGREGFVPGHTLGQYISGLARMGRTTGDPACANKVHALVDGFAATLGPKYQSLAAPNAEKLWPCYILDKHLAGLLDAYQLSGVAEVRDLLPRVFRGGLPYLPDTGRDRVGKKDPPYDETYIMPETLFAAYELTNDYSFYERAMAYMLDREFFDPLAAGKDVLPGRHAYSHAIALSSAGKARLVTGDQKYLRAMVTAWNLLETDQQFATGGWGPNETFITPRKGQLYESLHSTNDHFETPCGSYAAVKLARYLLCATGESRYGDGLERVVYNGFLAVKAPDADGDYFYYSTYGAHAKKVYYPVKWPCCSGTLIEGVADYVKDIFFRAADGVAVNLYVPSRVKWSQHDVDVTLTQETDAPLGDTVMLHVACQQPVDFALQLRVPAWAAAKPAIHVNGVPMHAVLRRGFAVVERQWRDGDTVQFYIEQRFHAEAIDDKHTKTVALMRGPLVYTELNPAANAARHAPVEALQPSDAEAGVFNAQSRTYVPFYQVGDESYTMYNERG
jgi:hypothetical protein